MESPLRWWTWKGQAGTGWGPGGGARGGHLAVRLSAQPSALWTHKSWVLLASSGLTVAILGRWVRVGPEAPRTSAHLCCCRLTCLCYWLSLCHEPWTSCTPCSPPGVSGAGPGGGAGGGFGQGDLLKVSQSTSVLFATARPCPLPETGKECAHVEKRPDMGEPDPHLLHGTRKRFGRQVSMDTHPHAVVIRG